MENSCISISNMSKLWLFSQFWFLPLNGIHLRMWHCCFFLSHLHGSQKQHTNELSLTTVALWRDKEPFRSKMKMFRYLGKPAVLSCSGQLWQTALWRGAAFWHASSTEGSFEEQSLSKPPEWCRELQVGITAEHRALSAVSLNGRSQADSLASPTKLSAVTDTQHDPAEENGWIVTGL